MSIHLSINNNWKITFQNVSIYKATNHLIYKYNNTCKWFRQQSVLISFLVTMTKKYPNRRNLREKAFIFIHSSWYSQSWWESEGIRALEQLVMLHVTLWIKNNARPWSDPSPLSIQSRTQPMKWPHSQFNMGIPISINRFKKTLHMQTQRPICLIILYSVKLTTHLTY